jgi:hypothetical protein
MPMSESDLPVQPPLMTSNQEVNLIDPKLIERALKRLQGLVKGNGLRVEDVSVESCTAKVYPFTAKTVLKLTPRYGVRVEPGRNTASELATSQEDFQKELSLSLVRARTEPAKRKVIVDTVFMRPDKGFGMKNQKMTFDALARNLVMHEGCPACSHTGKLQCAKCYGHGVLTCQNCQGRRQTVCPQCRGTGHTPTANGHQTCTKCRGDGKVSCIKCHGRGQVQCAVCKASGTLSCKKCVGTGWLSHLAHVEIESLISFDFQRDVLPPEVANMVESLGARLVEKGDVEVTLRPAPLHNQTQDKEPDDMIFIDYDAKVPHGNIQFRFKNRIIPATLFGYHGRLIEAPAFLDDLTKKGQSVLLEASKGFGNVAGKIARAAKYKMLQEVIVQTALRKTPRKALETLTAKYPMGITADRLLELSTLADAALQAITRKARLVGSASGLGIYFAFLLFYFVGNFRISLGLAGVPILALDLLDFVFLPIGFYSGVLGAQLLALLARRKALSSFLKPEVLGNTLPKAGEAVWWSLGGSLVLFCSVLAIAFLADIPLPDWLMGLL